MDRYEEALERANEAVKRGMVSQNFVDDIFGVDGEDERIRKNCIHFLELQKSHHASTIEIDECIAWLEKQKEQKPAEWSEEDEKIRQGIIKDIEWERNYTAATTCEVKVIEKYNEQIAWLKSLRPQPHWKPSEEQMQDLDMAARMNEVTCPSLKSLYNDLKKLM